MIEVVENRLSQLRNQPFVELAQLEPCQGTKVKYGRKVITLSVWKDIVGEDEIQVVVQAYEPWILGLGKMNAQGFRKNRVGELKELESEDLYEFL